MRACKKEHVLRMHVQDTGINMGCVSVSVFRSTCWSNRRSDMLEFQVVDHPAYWQFVLFSCFAFGILIPMIMS